MTVLVADLSATSPAAPGTVIGGKVSPDPAGLAIGNLAEYDGVWVSAMLQGATGGTLDIYIQAYDGVDWVDWIHFTQLAALAAAASFIYAPQTPTTHTVVTVGRNGVPALAANSSWGNHPGESLRLVFVAGAGTSAGALQTVRIVARRSWSRS